jgi:hypothetical protein
MSPLLASSRPEHDVPSISAREEDEEEENELEAFSWVQMQNPLLNATVTNSTSTAPVIP